MELSNILAEVQRTGVESRTEDYQDTISKLELLDAQLALLAETTPDVLSDLVRDMNGRLSALEQRGAGLDAPGLVEGASDKVNYAQIDFQRERYRSSYQNAREALVLMDRIELRLDERDYDQALGDSFQQFSDTIHGFAEILDMGAEILLRLLRGPDGQLQAGAVLMNVTNPADLREQIDKLAAKASTLQPPSTREVVQRQTTKMYDLAQSAAASFEKLLILDQFTREEGRKTILTAYLQMEEAKKRQQEIQQSIEPPRLGSRAPGQGIIRVR